MALNPRILHLAALATDMGQQLAANPRMAKLVPLASARRCKQQ
jgi:hypothetical protein